jgi:hypothetical protein
MPLPLRRRFYAILVVSVAAASIGVFLLFEPGTADISAGIMRSVDETSTPSTKFSLPGADATDEAGGAVTRPFEDRSDIPRNPNTAALAPPESSDVERPVPAVAQLMATKQAALTPDSATTAFSVTTPALPDRTAVDQRGAKHDVADPNAPSNTARRYSAGATSASPPLEVPPALPAGPSPDQPDVTSVSGRSEALANRSNTILAPPVEIAPDAVPTNDPSPMGGTSSTMAPILPATAIASLEAAKNAVSSSREPPRSAAETFRLVERGDQLFGIGDIASARLFYERAADAGDRQAALRLGQTFDPAFLRSISLRSMQGDVATAMSWYRRAAELGASEGHILIKSILAEQEQ